MNDKHEITNTTIIQTDIVNQSKQLIETSIVETDIAKISISPNVIETATFQKVLINIPQHIQKADQLLNAYRLDPNTFVNEIDEDSLNEQLKELQDVAIFARNIEKSRSEIKKYMNTVRDQLIEHLDYKLQSANYAQLEKATTDIKQLKKDIDATRAINRWEELKITFIANIERYPLIAEFTEELTDFSKFKLIYPKLVSGAKTKKVKESDHTFINETLYSWNTAIEIIKENVWELKLKDINLLLTKFKQEPSIEMINREGRQLKLNEEAEEKARAEAEKRQQEELKRRQEAELKRQQELIEIQKREREAKRNKDIAAQKAAEEQKRQLKLKAEQAEKDEILRKNAFIKFGGQYRTIFKESFPMFIQYLFENQNYHDVHTNPVTKAGLIYDIMKQVDNPLSIVVQETANDPQKILDLIRYILDA